MYSQLSQIFEIIKEMFHMVSINKTNVEKFLNACLNYSPSRILPLAELQADTFSKWNFEKEVNRDLIISVVIWALKMTRMAFCYLR